ncbi:hypothetical protein JXL19_10310 [bacterium]|nr:hypothetical protein [bacterium]
MKNKIRWLMISRVIVVTILFGSITFVNIKQESSSLSPFYILIAATYLLTVLYAVLYRYLNNMTVFAYIQLIGDVLLEICLIYFTGGIESTFSFTLIVSIITASIVLSRRGSLIIASISSILYGLLLDLQYFEVISLPSSYVPNPVALTNSYVLHTIFVNICAFYLAALLSGYLAESREKIGQKLMAKEEDLMELRAFNEDVLKNISTGLVVTDIQGKITLVNETALKILDIKNADDSRLFWKDVFQPLDFNQAIQSMKERINHIIKYNEFIDCKNRGLFFIGLTITFLKDGKGQIKGTITCFQDLTEYKKMEEKMKEAEILATIGGMAAGIAHELRNPLASIKGSIQLLAEGLTLDQDQKALMDIMLRESTNLNSIINEFLTFARPKPPYLEMCNLNLLINDTLTMLRNSEGFNHGISIITDLDPDNNYLELDINQIRQVLWNLAINACQAMPDGGTLSVKSMTKINGKLSYKLIEFLDTGVGISKEHISRVFHPFYTTKEKGTGLGLCTAYRIVESHGGKIDLESKPGKGSLFSIRLPLTASA